MPPKKELTRHQLSSRLAYQQNVPAFIRQLQNRVAGVVDPEDEQDNAYRDGDADGNYYTQYADDGRPPIPERPPADDRPPIPTRPEGDAGSADEEDDEGGDEAPQIVVLKAGRHLNAREVENEKRKVRGLAPLSDETETPQPASGSKKPEPPKSKRDQQNSLSFSSSSTSAAAAAAAEKKKKRKIVGDGADDLAEAASSLGPDKKKLKGAKKKPGKALLSFGDDER